MMFSYLSLKRTKLLVALIFLGWIPLLMPLDTLATQQGTPMLHYDQTFFVKDIYPGTERSIQGMHGTWLGSVFYFQANDGIHGMEVWRSDGTPNGTYLLADINPGSEGSDPYGFTVFNHQLYFGAFHPTYGTELWSSTGIDGETRIVKDINPATNPSLGPISLTPLKDQLIFVADNGINGTELWSTDGTSKGTTMIKDIFESGSGFPMNLTEMNGEVFFRAYTPTYGSEPWKTNGTPEGTLLLRDIEPGAGGSYPRDFLVIDHGLHFIAETTAFGYEPWTSNGTLDGTHLVHDILPGPQGSIAQLHVGVGAVSGGRAFFVADDGIHGSELWQSDGTKTGTVLVQDICAGPNGSRIDLWNMVAFERGFYLTADDCVHGLELWRSDGTDSGTNLVSDLSLGILSSELYGLTVIRGTVYFTHYDGAYGHELWRSDGTESGTRLLLDSIPGPGSGYPFLDQRWVSDTSLFFVAIDSEHGQELWTLRIQEPTLYIPTLRR